jgi:hypothetical protein
MSGAAEREPGAVVILGDAMAATRRRKKFREHWRPRDLTSSDEHAESRNSDKTKG